MLAAAAGLAYFLSNLLRLEVCFLSVAVYFELPRPALFEAFVKIQRLASQFCLSSATAAL
ncbi:hypothetical protein KC19_VG330000 [Ceratodon purpureus]|uniref:Uncharacterized protein n=1 Tax=Ceratodon purpureus TaxID=3225 RepID=A0A8T0HXZ9_CERPU|nr:hypothetical protein KC19_VG330000 [Ceratodon purpureus]